MFRKLDLFPFSREGVGDTLLGPWSSDLALSKGPNRVAVSHSSPEDGNRSSCRNVEFSNF
jgi:hypothetical protein